MVQPLSERALTEVRGCVHGLGSTSVCDRARAAKELKNAVIGNRTKKEAAVSFGLIERLKHLLEHESEPDVLRDATAVAASLALAGHSLAQASVRGGLISALMALLDHRVSGVSQHASRAVRALLADDSTAADVVAALSDVDSLIARLRSTDSDVVRQAMLHLIRAFARDRDHQLTLLHAGVLDALRDGLRTAADPATAEAYMRALAAVVRGQTGLALALSLDETLLDQMRAVVTGGAPGGVVAAASCLDTLLREAGPGGQAERATVVLPAVVRVLGEPVALLDEAAAVLATMVENDQALQRAACDGHAVRRLVQHLSREEISDRARASVLEAVAAACSLLDDGRQQAVDAEVLPALVAALRHPQPRVRAAAATCARSLSRAVRSVRFALLDTSLARPLVDCLADEHLSVQVAASAALCNLVLDFSPLKRFALEKDCLERLVRFTEATEPLLRLNGVWALKNLVYMADSVVKNSVLAQLTFPRLLAYGRRRRLDSCFFRSAVSRVVLILRVLGVIAAASLCTDADVRVREQALNLIRNLAFVHSRADLDSVFGDTLPALLAALEAQFTDEASADVLAQTLYVLCNLATGGAALKDQLLASAALPHVVRLLLHPRPELRAAALWVIINLTWREESWSTVRLRVHRLCAMGVDAALALLVDDVDLDVRERAREAAAQFRKAGGAMAADS